MRRKIPRYQVKLFLLCLLLGAIPVIVLGIFAYVKFSSTIQNKVHSGNEQLLQQTQLQIESMLRLIDFSVFQFANSPPVLEAANRKFTNKDFQLVDTLFDSMQRIQVYELGVKEIQLINLEQQWVIGNHGYVSLAEFPGRSRLPFFQQSELPSRWVTDDDNHLYLVKKLPLYTKPTTGLIVARMSVAELFRSLPRTSELGTVMILDEKGRPIAASSGSERGQTDIGEAYVKDMLDSSARSGYVTGDIEGAAYGITFLKSAYNGWIYLSVVSIGEITRESHAIGWATVWACAVILLLILVLSFQGAQKMYSPVRKLYLSAVRPEDDKAGQQPGDEFSAIEQALESMSSSNRTMTTQLERLHLRLKHDTVVKLIRGELQPRELREQLGMFGYAQPFRRMAVVALQIDNLADTRYEEKDRDLLLYAVGNIVEELIPASQRMIPVVTEQVQATVLTGEQETEEAFKSFIVESVEQIRHHVAEFLSLRIRAGISRSYTGYDQTHRAYQEGLDALKYRITRNQEAVLFIEDVEPERQMVFFPDHLEKQLVEAVKFVDERKAAALLGEFMEIVANRDLTYNQLQNWLMKLLLDLVYIPEQQGIDIPEFIEGEVPLHTELSGLGTMEEIEDWFLQRIIEPILRATDTGKEAQYQKISQEVIRIIQSEYDRDLTLEECASRLHYHASYIRRVLKKSLNVNFSDYLLQYRMEVAKRWLLETDMKISDIALKLRYNNAQNFIRYFKKLTGLTPGQYREQWSREEPS